MQLSIGDTVYSGLAAFEADNTAFRGRAYSNDGGIITIRGSLLHDGVLQVIASGAANFTELYTTGASHVAGGDGAVLRAYTVAGDTYYRFAASLSSVGEEATVTCLNTDSPFVVGAILVVETATQTIHVRIDSWGSTTSGLTPADKWIGTYTADGKDDLTLDGFGKLKLGSTSGSYRQNGKWIVANLGDLRGFILDTDTMTYTEGALPFSASSFAGKTFSLSYYFFCDDIMYDAETSFAFLADGTVSISSTSSSHDSGSDGCAIDRYTPAFTTTDTRVATYTVSADLLTVSVGGINFVFYVEDVIYINQIKLQSTTLSSDSHGYISIGAVLVIN